jgi:hypothetical protein
MRPPSSSPCDQPWAPDKEQTWKTSASSRIPVLAAQPFNQLLGATLSGVGPSRAELKLPITREIEQQHGCVHGGVDQLPRGHLNRALAQEPSSPSPERRAVPRVGKCLIRTRIEPRGSSVTSAEACRELTALQRFSAVMQLFILRLASESTPTSLHNRGST